VCIRESGGYQEMMKIGIDASLNVGEKAGVGSYTASLIEGLAAVDSRNKYVLYPFFYYIFDPDFKSLRPPAANFSVHFQALPDRWIRFLWNRSRIPRHLLLGKLDVLHSTTFCAPAKHFGKLVVTIYDISFLRYPEHHTEANRIHCLRGTLDAARWADRIIAISEHTKRDLIEYLNIKEERINVALGAARREFHPRPECEVQTCLRERWQLYKPYLLSVGTVEPRKNTRLLIRSYCSLPAEIREQYPLVLAGGKGWLSSNLYAWVQELGAGSTVKLLGYVPQADLPLLYCGAACFLYPSLYEGFGLPPLEAMACGTPVITSNTSSLPEVVGDAGILIDPRSEIELKEAIRKVLDKPGLCQEMSRKSLQRASLFSWEKTAKETLRVYESCFV
jgi:glycosyltransferase involved in cell wall biosynthesis